MTHRLARLAEGLTGAILTVALLAGPPWLLTTRVGPPLPSSWPDLDTLRAIATTGVTDTFVITTLAVIVWIAWAQLALAITTELIAAVRHRPAVRLPLLPGTRPLAARLVAATLLLVTILQPRPVATAAPLDLAVTTATTSILDAQPAVAPEATVAVRAVVEPPTRAIQVGERDSWWSLAENHLDAGTRWRELRDLNLHRTQPDGTTITTATDRLQPGWTLLVPATDTDNPAPAEADAPADPIGDTAPMVDEQWHVEQGDHFWHIATTTLEHAWDRTPDDNEIVPYWQQLIDTNRERLAPPGDPDLIHPGQQFQLPAPPADPLPAETEQASDDTQPAIETGEEGTSSHLDAPEPQAPGAAAVPHAGEDPQVQLEGGETPPDHGESAPEGDPRYEAETFADQHSSLPQEAEDDVLAGGTGVSDLTATESPSTGWEHTVTTRPAQAASPVEVGDPADGLTLNLWSRLAAGVGAAGLAGAGITALVSWRRRYALQQRPFGTRLPTPAPDTLDHLHRLELAAPDERTTLGALSDLLTTIPTTARPAIVTLADDGTVRLLFADDTDPGQPAAPWRDASSSDNEPTGWTAHLQERGPRRSIGLPLLLTLGRTDGQTILINLGSVPTLAVCGPADAVADELHAATFEVATSRIAGPLSVVVTGADAHPALDQARTTDDLTGVLEVARQERAQQIIDDDRTVSLVVAHAGAVLPDLDEATGDPLLGVIRAADTPPAGAWTITVNDDETATLHLPDGGLVALQRPELDLDGLRSELDRHDQQILDLDDVTVDILIDDEASPQEQQHGDPADQPPAGSSGVDLSGAGVAEGSAPMAAASLNWHAPAEPSPADPALQIRILGPVEVHRDGEPLTGLAPLTLQILVYLASHRDGVTPERLDDVIWNGQLPSPNSQRLRSALTKLRNTLGPAPDGEPFLPRRQYRTDLIRLAGPVTTDLDQAIEHLEHARAVTGTERLTYLDRALDHVRGEPFAGWPLSWASEIAERAIAQLQDAAAAAAAGHRRRQEYEAAEHAIRTGLKLSDPNETLYLEWARLEAARGRHDQITRIRQRLQAAYDTHADETAGFVGTITPSTAAAFEQLQAGATT